jgi:pyruvate/2-oxoglutarate dehydrogenase complex dihydrolipoamide acyltransferase (E2) component
MSAMKLTVPLPRVLPGAATDVYVVAEWRKRIGEAVQQGETLALVRPAAGDDGEAAPPVPVPSPAFGVLSRLGALAGEAVEVGEPLAVLAGVPEPLEGGGSNGAAVPLPPRPLYVPRGPEEVVALSAADRALGEHFALSARTMPHVYTVAQADVSEPLRLSGRAGNDTPLPLLALVVHAVAAGLRRHPALNAQRVTPAEVRRKGYVHVGLALRGSADGRLAVPVVRDADRRSLPDLAREVANLTARARSGALTEDDVRPGATFTVALTETAAPGVLYQTALLHRPQAALLSVGPVVRAPAVVAGPDGAEVVAVRPQVSLCLAHDTRIVPGEDAIAFLGAVVEGLSDAAYLFG